MDFFDGEEGETVGRDDVEDGRTIRERTRSPDSSIEDLLGGK